jgi:hypothetical protein
MQRLISGVRLAALILAGSTLIAGCGSDTTPSTLPTPNPVTETFTGTVSQNSVTIQPFTANAAGAIAATLTTLAPLSTITMGFSLGTYSGTTCQVVLDNAAAVQGSILTGTAATQGSFCVRVYDVGNIAAGSTVSFTLTVTHN